jgi:hypothetical protein
MKLHKKLNKYDHFKVRCGNYYFTVCRTLHITLVHLH